MIHRLFQTKGFDYQVNKKGLGAAMNPLNLYYKTWFKKQINFKRYIEKFCPILSPIHPSSMLFLSICNHFNISYISFLGLFMVSLLSCHRACVPLLSLPAPYFSRVSSVLSVQVFLLLEVFAQTQRPWEWKTIQLLASLHILHFPQQLEGSLYQVSAELSDGMWNLWGLASWRPQLFSHWWVLTQEANNDVISRTLTNRKGRKGESFFWWNSKAPALDSGPRAHVSSLNQDTELALPLWPGRCKRIIWCSFWFCDAALKWRNFRVIAVTHMKPRMRHGGRIAAHPTVPRSRKVGSLESFLLAVLYYTSPNVSTSGSMYLAGGQGSPNPLAPHPGGKTGVWCQFPGAGAGGGNRGA